MILLNQYQIEFMRMQKKPTHRSGWAFNFSNLKFEICNIEHAFSLKIPQHHVIDRLARRHHRVHVFVFFDHCVKHSRAVVG